MNLDIFSPLIHHKLPVPIDYVFKQQLNWLVRRIPRLEHTYFLAREAFLNRLLPRLHPRSYRSDVSHESFGIKAFEPEGVNQAEECQGVTEVNNWGGEESTRCGLEPRGETELQVGERGRGEHLQAQLQGLQLV